MALRKTIPDNSKFIPTVNIFTATFNTPALGKYEFTRVAENQSQVVLPMTRNQIFFLDRINFGATIPEGDFLLATSVLPEIILKFKVSGERVFKKPFRIVNYIDSQEISTWIWTHKGDDTLVMDFTGVLNQIASLVGIDTITAHVSLNLYEVSQEQYKYRFFEQDRERGVRP